MFVKNSIFIVFLWFYNIIKLLNTRLEDQGLKNITNKKLSNLLKTD